MKSNDILDLTKTFLVKYEPELLMAMGLSGLLYSSYASVKSTIKSVRQIDAEKERLNKEKLGTKEIIKLVWKNYIPTLISTAISVPCIIAGNQVSGRRNAALAAAYTLSETALQEYKEKTKEIVGERKEQQIQEEVSKAIVQKTYNPNAVIVTNDGDSLFYEPISGRYFRSNWNKIKEAANNLNADAIGGADTITLTDWFYALGLDRTDISDTIGWSTMNGRQNLLNVCPNSCLTPDNVPCGSISYIVMPEPLSRYY